MRETLFDWEPDVLGPEFQQRTLPLGQDAEGPVVATLVRHVGKRAAGPLADVDVLYVHGWSDYFFQADLARWWAARGARFYALDLRKYGRSLRQGQTPGYIEDLSTYDDEIGQAVRVMGTAAAGRRLIPLGHSTGGLTLSLWADRHPGKASALILNAPWLELQTSGVGRQALSPLVDVGARVDPLGALPSVDFGYYSRAVSKRLEGEWVYDEAWRPERGFPVRPGWLRAIFAGHAKVAAGLSIDAPIFTLLSAHDALTARWSPAMLHADSVLVVRDVAERATRLGSTVTVSRIDGALHDVFLSRQPAREHAYAAMDRWVGGYVAAPTHQVVTPSS